MNVTKEILRINAREAERNVSVSGSWHNQFKDSAYIFVGNIPFDLTEGDIIAVFSQYGEILNVDLVRDRLTGESKGFAFLRYEDQRSTILAVDNLNGIQLLGRTIRVDHANAEDKDGNKRTGMNAAPEFLLAKRPSEHADLTEESEGSDEFANQVDPDDPMRDYLIKKLKKEKRKAQKRAKKDKKQSKKGHIDGGDDHELDRKEAVRSRRLSSERGMREPSPSSARAQRHRQSISKSRSRSRSKDRSYMARSRGRSRSRERSYRRRRSRSLSRDRGRRDRKIRSRSIESDHDKEQNHPKSRYE